MYSGQRKYFTKADIWNLHQVQETVPVNFDDYYMHA